MAMESTPAVRHVAVSVAANGSPLPSSPGTTHGRDRTAYHRGHDQKPGRDRREHGDPSERHILGQTQWVCQEASGPEAGETAAQTRRAGRVSRGRSVTKADTRLARPALL